MIHKLLLTLSLFVIGSIAVAEDNTPFRAGAASAVVNPPVGSYIAGDARNRKFTGVHDDLYAKAVFIHDGQSAVAFVVVDCLGLLSHTVQQIQNEAAKLADLPGLTAERIIVASTHCHNGPDIVGLWGPDVQTSGVDPKYMDRLVATAARQVQRAAASLVPATLHTAQIQSKVDWVLNECEPDELDRTLTVLKLQSTGGKCIATITNFACHPTILDGVHNVVSADWVGGLYRGMADKLDGEHLFFQGAVGGWVQPAKGNRSFELADRYGREIASESLSALEQATITANPRIDFASTTISIPVQNEGWKQLSQLGVLPIKIDESVETAVAAVHIGDIGIATHPGETAPEHSRITRKMLGTRTTMVIGLALDALGYISKPDYFLHPEKYPHAEYLNMTSVGPEAAPVILEGLRVVTRKASP